MYLLNDCNLSVSDDIAMCWGQMEQAAGTMKIRKHPTPSTWNGACRNGLDLNQDCLSNFSIMTGNANIPGAAMEILEATTYDQ